MTMPALAEVAASSAAQKVFVEIAILFPPKRRLFPALEGLTRHATNYGAGYENIFLGAGAPGRCLHGTGISVTERKRESSGFRIRYAPQFQPFSSWFYDPESSHQTAG
jgi:hypothetical protein